MQAEWSAECTAEDPVLVVPWNDDKGTAHFVDLRAEPYDLHLIPEAEQQPPLMQALRALNAGRSPVYSAKCDFWPLDDDELANVRMHLDIDPQLAQAGFASYIDLLWRDQGIATSRPRLEQILDRLVRLAAAIDAPLATLECVLRPAVVDLSDTFEGYAITLYIKAVGSDADHALAEWGDALSETVKLLRGRDFAAR